MKMDAVKEADWPEISRIWNDVFPGNPLPADLMRKQALSEFSLDPRGIFCVRERSGPAGFAIATDTRIPYTSPKPFLGCLAAVAVRKDRRGRGLGSALAEKAGDYLRSRGNCAARTGYPTYLRGTILSAMGVDIENPGAVKFFESLGYAPVKAIDSVARELSSPGLSEEISLRLGEAGERGVVSGALEPGEEEAFLRFLEDEFPGSWHRQFARLHGQGLLKPGEVLVMKKDGAFLGFAGPFQVSCSGDTCGIGLGVARGMRGRGLGLFLLFGILSFARGRGASRVTLFGAVDKINYYRKAGFRPAGVFLVMEKGL